MLSNESNQAEYNEKFEKKSKYTCHSGIPWC